MPLSPLNNRVPSTGHMAQWAESDTSAALSGRPYEIGPVFPSWYFRIVRTGLGG